MCRIDRWVARTREARSGPEAERAGNGALSGIEGQEGELPRVGCEIQRRRKVETVGAPYVTRRENMVYLVRERSVDVDPVHQLQFRVRKRLPFPCAGTPHLRIEQRMRQDDAEPGEPSGNALRHGFTKGDGNEARRIDVGSLAQSSARSFRNRSRPPARFRARGFQV